jgi:hypothetical protein
MQSVSLAIVAVLFTLPACAQVNDWARLGTLTTEKRVSALTHDGKYIQGRFRTWTAEGMEVFASGRNQWLKPAEVKRVWVQEKAPRWRAALIGAAIGFGVAFPIGATSAGYLADQNNPRFSTRAGFGAGFGLFGAGIGAGIGALAGGRRNVLVYRGETR